jgi:hypothetical protein
VIGALGLASGLYFVLRDRENPAKTETSPAEKEELDAARAPVAVAPIPSSAAPNDAIDAGGTVERDAGAPRGFPSLVRSLDGGSHVGGPSVHDGAVRVSSGNVPVEVIQRIVRQNHGRFRLCYESGLRTNPKLAGRVTVKFTIGPSGAVNTVSDGGSDLPDQAVISCVIRNFGVLEFPRSEGPTVSVIYPLVFSPS